MAQRHEAAGGSMAMKEDIMMRRRFFVTAATTLGMTFLLPLVSGRSKAWADDHGNDHKSDDHQDDHHNDDEDDENRKVTICERGDTEQVKLTQLPEEIREGATLGRCHASPDR